ncbi:MAG: aminotransferase class I/II-fold pyridoxal phosphate-dependent enzyme [Endomicrobiaceae bacterium]|nr:aminotransferase class I/II-fold pyridoxal phosphate-dependent enzyme [Endomicrobiaceae bacterium]
MIFLPSFKLNITWTDLFLLFKSICSKNNDNLNLDFLKKHIGNKYILDVPSSRWGLFFLLKALNLQKGDEVIIPAYTYFAVPSAVIRAGCVPVFVDIEENAINMDTTKIESCITKKTKVIIATHLCGFPCDLIKIKEISEKYNLMIIEDCAQAFGSKFNNDFVGKFAKASYYSFSITKNLTMLRGGIVATDDELIADKIQQETDKMLLFTKFQMFKDCVKAAIMKIATSKIIVPFTCIFFYLFSLAKFDIAKIIFKEKQIFLDNDYPKYGKLNYSQKKLAENQLKNFNNSCNIKEKNGKFFYKLLQNTKHFKTPKLLDNCKNIFSGMPIFVNNKDFIRKKLLAKGIDTSTGFVQNCTDIPEFKKYAKTNYPNALRAEKELLYFLTSDTIKNHDIEYITNILNKL